MSDGRLQWQCRRGMRELDELLAGYLQSSYEKTTEPEKAAFRALLELPDPEMIAYILGNLLHDDPDIADVIEKVRSRT